MTSTICRELHSSCLLSKVRGITKTVVTSPNISTKNFQNKINKNSHRNHSSFKSNVRTPYTTQISNNKYDQFTGIWEKFNTRSTAKMEIFLRSHSTEQNGDKLSSSSVRNANEILLRKQKEVHQLLKYVNSPLYDEEFQDIYNNFNIEEHADYFQPKEYEQFINFWKNEKLLQKGANFSIFNDAHLRQVKFIYGLLHTAKDYEKFHETSIWLRKVLNESMFLYVFAVAVLHRADTQGLALPPIYELYPQYFFNNDIMQKVYDIKKKHFSGGKRSADGSYTVRQDPSRFYDPDPEKSFSYYMEDLGISAFYNYFNQYFPHWMNAKEYELDEKRGELYYYVHHQLLARYYLERISNGLGPAENLDWDGPLDSEFNPSLTYPNGTAFPNRPKKVYPKEYFKKFGQRWKFNPGQGYGFTYIDEYEKRVADAIDLGYAYDVRDGSKVDFYPKDCTNTIASIIEGNEDSLNLPYFGSCMNFARFLVANTKEAPDNYSITPSALEHFETSCRDPAFYKLCKRVTQLMQKYKANLPPYSKTNLTMPGVEIQSVEMGPFVTIYDKFYSDITNGLELSREEYENGTDFRVKIEQYRLNYKTFPCKIIVNSDKHIKATMKIFIGPKFDEQGREIRMVENRNNFVEWDQFICDLVPGRNEITRNSRDLLWFGRDRTSYLDVYKHVTSNPEEVYKVDDFMNAYPQRFLLPRGTAEGKPFQIYVIFYPYESFQSETTALYYQTKYNQDSVFTTKAQDNENDYDRLDQYKMIRIDSYPMGYPFDRPAEFDTVYDVPNSHLMDIKVYHEKLKTEN